MYSSALYAELRERTGLDPGWRGVGGLRLATTPERVEELQPPGQRGHHVRADDGAAVAGRDRRSAATARCRATCSPAGWLPGDGFLRPEALTRALAAGARALGVEFATGTRVTGIDGRRRPGARRASPTRRDRDRGRRQRGRRRGRLHRPAGRGRPSRSCPIKHQYVVQRDPLGRPRPRGDPDRARPRPHRLLPRARATPSWSAATSARPRCAGRPTAARRWREPAVAVRARPGRVRRVVGGRPARRVPALRAVGIARVVHGPEAFTPDGEFLLGETAVRRVLGGGRVLRARPGRGRRRRQGDGRVDRGRYARSTTCPTWTSAASAPTRRAGAWATAKALDAYSRYYDIVYPGQEWTRRPAAAPLGRPGPGCPTLDAALGEKAGWERVNWFGVQRRRRRRGAAPARLGRAGLVAGHRGRGPGDHRRRPGCSTSPRSPSSTCAAPAALRFLQRLCANDVDRPAGDARLHPAAQRARRHRGRPDRHPARRGPLPDRDQHRLRRARRGLAPPARAATA